MVNSLVSELYRKRSNYGPTKLKVKSTNDGAERLREHLRGEGMLSELSLIWCCSSWIIKLVIKKTVTQRGTIWISTPRTLVSLEMECTFPFDANHAWDEACWYAVAYPQSASRSKIQTDQLFFSWNSGGEALAGKKKTGSRHTAFLQSGNILTNCCIRGCFFPGFLLEVLDTLIFHPISPK